MDKKEVIDGLFDHKSKVKFLVGLLIGELTNRAVVHDEDKLDPEELDLFIKFTPKLATCEYGSQEYKDYLIELTPALKLHYEKNRHHPEHFEKNGIGEMNLIDILEMLCDWLASTKRQKNGDIFKSIGINQKRFGYGDELGQILFNTAKFLIEKDEEIEK